MQDGMRMCIILLTCVRIMSACNENEGGEQLDVDIYDRVDRGGSILATFKDLCSCQNLPKDLHHLRLSVDNHGNAMKVYTGQDCSGESKLIFAGRSPDSDKINSFEDFGANLKLHSVNRDILSIGPFQNSSYFQRHCIKLYSNIFKFEFLDFPHEEKLLVEENIELSAKTKHRNNESSKFTLEYSVAKNVREAVEISIASGFRNMHKVGVEASFEVESEFGVPFLTQSNFKAGLKRAYEYSRTARNSKGNSNKTTILENARDFTIRKQIEVTPCTERIVQGFVRMVKKRPIDYKAYTKVTGELGKEKMKSGQIRKYMDKGLEYVRALDEYTIVAIATGQIRADYGMKTVLNVDSKPLLI